jgi:hypothetical protein
VRRREFIRLVGGAAAAWPLAARAQKESRAGKVGILMAFPESDRDIQARVTAFRQELRKVGWSEGVNLHISMSAGRRMIWVVCEPMQRNS